jgi:hypothetical protein
MSFEQNLQQWISLDNQMKKLNEQMKEWREKKNALEQNITQYASSHHLFHSAVQTSDGKLKFAHTRVPEPITFKYLEKTLGEIIKNEVQVNQIMEHIKQKRNIKVVPEIKRFFNH